jgi:hypothetical protein
MSEQVWQMIQDLRRCTFVPGTFDKRYVRGYLAGLTKKDKLSEKGLLTLGRLHYRYRKQIQETRR